MENENIILIKSDCGKHLLHIDKTTGKRIHVERILQDDEYARNKIQMLLLKKYKRRKKL